jgi:methylenetetrahydrofolate reductase (NADPH)
MAFDKFKISIEVVPPAGPDIQPLLSSLKDLANLPIDSFSVATNPVAKPRMSALAAAALIQQQTGRSATLHCTTRDHNRLSLQGLLWGARAMGLTHVLVASGDRVALGDRQTTSSVEDLTLYELIAFARQAGLNTGVVFDHHPEINGLDTAVRRLGRKVEAGAQFVVTQPVYDAVGVETIYQATRGAGLPAILGILPLRSARHADFLHHKVAGISVPDHIRERMHKAADAVAEGILISRDVLSLAMSRFSGACLMPPFDHYEILAEILK